MISSVPSIVPNKALVSLWCETFRGMAFPNKARR
jgi:hypothetical protein